MTLNALQFGCEVSGGRARQRAATRSGRRFPLTVLALACLVASRPGASDAAAPGRPSVTATARATASIGVQLSDIARGRGGFIIDGILPGGLAGADVDVIGDMNQDGLQDLAITQNVYYRSNLPPGRVYVVFGQQGREPVDLAAVAAGRGGFVVDGDFGWRDNPSSVAAAGDVNGDGLPDLLIGARTTPRFDFEYHGRVYVVFGKTDGAPVQISEIEAGRGGFVVVGSFYDAAGNQVSGAGDVNGDGLADLIISASGAYETQNMAYVVFGKTDGDTVQADFLGVREGLGYKIVSDTDHPEFLTAQAAGDVNGDGLADVIVGNYYWSRTAYVVFGKSDSQTLYSSQIEQGQGVGFTVRSTDWREDLGFSVAGGGDVNGDGLADVVIGAPHDVLEGRAYVIFGKTDSAPIDVIQGAVSPSSGFVIVGESLNDGAGSSVAPAGDINGDGLADLVIGSPRLDSAKGVDAGRSYVVFGRTDQAPVLLANVTSGGIGGFAIEAQRAGQKIGSARAGAGDVNGDGLPDLLIGAASTTTAVGVDTGRSYLIFGDTKGAFIRTAVDLVGTRRADLLRSGPDAKTVLADAGDDTLVGRGADVLLGGKGDDTFLIDEAMAQALTGPMGTGGNWTQLSRIDGGTGFDTLAVLDTGTLLDLGAIAGKGASLPGSVSRLESIERIDLTGLGGNALRLGVRDVQDLADMNRINASTQDALGWRNGSYKFPAKVTRHQLVIHGDSGDLVTPVRRVDWRVAGSVTFNDSPYTVYESKTGRAQLLVNNLVRWGEPSGAGSGRYETRPR